MPTSVSVKSLPHKLSQGCTSRAATAVSLSRRPRDVSADKNSTIRTVSVPLCTQASVHIFPDSESANHGTAEMSCHEDAQERETNGALFTSGGQLQSFSQSLAGFA